MISLSEHSGTSFVERVHAFFTPEGELGRVKNFEFREEQQRMAVAVANALENGRHLVVEAGTGVGKSLAYLVPAVLWAIEQKGVALDEPLHQL
jgi:ATP-dependent DNA helicase DinG